MRAQSFLLGAVALCALLVFCAGCQRESSGGAGWASEVPADAIRYIPQPVEVKPSAAAPADAPAVEQERTPQRDANSTAQANADSAPERQYAAHIKDPVEITLWHAYRATELDALKQATDAFTALGTPITVVLRAVPFDAFNDKIRVVVPRGRGPDLFIFAHDTIGAWAEMDIIEPLSNLTTAEDRAIFLPDTVKALVYRNALYGLPLAFKSVALFYNKALVPEPPTTLDALIDVAKAQTTGERHGLVYEAANLYFHAPWLYGYGGGVLDDNDRPIIRTPAAEKALALARRLVRELKVTPMSVNTGMVSGYFNDGKAAMVINGPWMRGELREDLDYGVSPLPLLAEGQPARPYLGVEAIFLNKQSPNKEAAIEVARFLTSDASARIRFAVGKQPVANRAIWESGEAASDPVMTGFLEQSKVAVVMPSTPAMQQIWTPYSGALLSVISGNGKPGPALAEAQRDAERNLGRSRGEK